MIALLAALAISVPAPEPKPSKPSPLLITDADAGKNFTVAVDQVVVVKLKSQVTGYRWLIAKHAPLTLRPLGSSRMERANPERPGTPDTTVFNFIGVAPGFVELEFAYKRPFGKQETAKRLRVKVRVDKEGAKP